MNIGIVGLGLIGGSLGRSIIKNTANVVYGADADESSLIKAELLNAVNYRLTKDNVNNLDMLIVATNPRTAIKIINDYSPLLKEGTIVIDTCGIKKTIVNCMQKLAIKYPKLEYIGVHPMAGREYSGIKHSTNTLFEKAYFIMVNVNAHIATMAKMKDLFKELGAENTVITSAEEHDRIIAYTSQLAHVISNAYMRSPTSKDYLGFSAGSFRDMTRVARLNSKMWTELFCDNKDFLLKEIDTLIGNLQEVRNAIADNDEEKLNSVLADGTQRKELAESMRRENK